MTHHSSFKMLSLDKHNMNAHPILHVRPKASIKLLLLAYEEISSMVLQLGVKNNLKH